MYVVFFSIVYFFNKIYVGLIGVFFRDFVYLGIRINREGFFFVLFLICEDGILEVLEWREKVYNKSKLSWYIEKSK